MRAVETPKPPPPPPAVCKCGCGRILDPLRNRSGWSGYCNAAKQRSGDRASRVWTPEKLSDAALAELSAQVAAEVQRRRAAAQATLQALSGGAG